MTSNPDDNTKILPDSSIDTGGGANIPGHINIDSGDFVGRDKITHNHNYPTPQPLPDTTSKKESSVSKIVYRTSFAAKLSLAVIYTLWIALIFNVISQELYEWLQDKLGENYPLNLPVVGCITAILILVSIIPIEKIIIGTLENFAQTSSKKRAIINSIIRVIIFFAYLFLILVVSTRIPPFYKVITAQINQTKVSDRESLILVADFDDRSHGKFAGIELTQRIIEELRRYADDLPVKILPLNKIVDSPEAAQKFAQQYHCQYYVVVYGWYDAAGIYPHIEQQKMPCSPSSIDLKHLTFPDEKQFKLKVTEVLPQQLTYFCYLILGHARKSTDDLEEALQFYKKAFDLALEESAQIDVTQVVKARAEVYRLQGKLITAIDDYSMLIQRDTNNPTNYYNQGLIYLDLNDDANAVLDFTRAISLYNQSLYNQGSQTTPSKAEIYRRRGFAYLNIGDKTQAINDLKKQVELIPNTATAYRDLGYIYRLDEQFELAIRSLTQAIKLNANDPDAYTNRGLVYREQKKYNDAIQDFTEAIKVGSSYVDAYRERGHTYLQIGKQEAALEDFNKQVELAPDSALPYRDRAWLYLLYKDWDKAIDDYDTTLNIDNNDVDALFNRGKAYLGKGNEVLAEKAFRDVLSAAHSDDPFYDLATEELERLTPNYNSLRYPPTPQNK